jgi:hypothetical protein
MTDAPKKRRNPFDAWRDKWSYHARRDPDLAASVKVIMWAIADHLNRKTGTAFPSLQTLARECGLSRSTVVVALKAAEKRGHIHITKRVTKTGRRTSNLFRPRRNWDTSQPEATNHRIVGNPDQGSPKSGPEPLNLTAELKISAASRRAPSAPSHREERKEESGRPTNGVRLDVAGLLKGVAPGKSFEARATARPSDLPASVAPNSRLYRALVNLSIARAGQG